MKIHRHECPWCLEQFAGTDKQAMADRREHIDENECGLVPRQDREMANKLKNAHDYLVWQHAGLE